MRILFSQPDYIYFRITAEYFKYYGRKGFHRNKKFVKANGCETDIGYRISGCGSVCIQVVPPDPKVHKLAATSSFMDGGYTSTKLDAPKSMLLPTFCSYRVSVS